MHSCMHTHTNAHTGTFMHICNMYAHACARRRGEVIMGTYISREGMMTNKTKQLKGRELLEKFMNCWIINVSNHEQSEQFRYSNYMIY